ERGFSHALQIDADGQHDAADIPALLALAKANPEALVSGWPQYGDDMPRSRRYGRWITHFWVWIETLSLAIKDSMCGFRVYPLAARRAPLPRPAGAAEGQSGGAGGRRAPVRRGQAALAPLPPLDHPLLGLHRHPLRRHQGFDVRLPRLPGGRHPGAVRQPRHR